VGGVAQPVADVLEDDPREEQDAQPEQQADIDAAPGPCATTIPNQ
jgi:hypothetical protein